MGDFTHGKTVYAGLGKVNAAAVPGLVGAVAHALVQEGVVGFGLGGADLLGLDEFRRLFKDVGGTRAPAAGIV